MKKYVSNPFEKIRTLIIDDNTVDRKILRAQLEDMGFLYVQEANQEDTAIFKIENAQAIGKPFELLISDWKMPATDGITLLRYLKSKGVLKESWLRISTGSSI